MKYFTQCFQIIPSSMCSAVWETDQPRSMSDQLARGKMRDYWPPILYRTEAQLKEVTAQFLMLIQHNMSLLNMLSSILASECCCVASFQSSLGSLFTQENMVTPTSGPQSSKHHITANLGVVSISIIFIF